MLPIDTSEYECIRAPVVDEFAYNRDGVQIPVDAKFISDLCSNHNRQAANTGSYSALVVGHTIDNAPEHDQPQKVGILANWAPEPWVNDDGITVTAAFADHYIKKSNDLVVNGVVMKLSAKDLVEKFPRRSGEIWFGSRTCDPHCMLGATAPERNLGLLRLSKDRGLSYTYTSPGVLGPQAPTRLAKMPQELDQAADLPIVKTLEEKVAQLTQALEAAQGLIESLQALQAPEQPQGHELQGGQDSDFEAILSQMGHGAQPPQDPSAQLPQGPAKMAKNLEADDLRARLAKSEEEKQALARDLSKVGLVARLQKMKDDGVDIDPTDKDLIDDLICNPPDVIERQLARLSKNKVPGTTGPNFRRALDANAPKRIVSLEQKAEVVARARLNKVDFDVAKKELGYE